MVGTHPAATGWVPDAAVLEEPTAEGIHKDGDGPDQASDGVNDLAHLPGRSPVLADLCVTSLGLGHDPHLLPGSSPPRQGQRVIRGEVPEKARRAYGMGCGGVDTIPDTAAGVIGVGADEGYRRERGALGGVSGSVGASGPVLACPQAFFGGGGGAPSGGVGAGVGGGRGDAPARGSSWSEWGPLDLGRVSSRDRIG